MHEYQTALESLPGLDLVPQQWLHLTVQGVGFTDQVHDLDRVVQAARDQLSHRPAIRTTFRDAFISDEAIVLPPDTGDGLQDLRKRLREALANTWTTQAVPESPDHYRPHISIAYINAPETASPYIEAVRQVKPTTAALTLTDAALIELNRDQGMYQWQTIGTIPLAGQ